MLIANAHVMVGVGSVEFLYRHCLQSRLIVKYIYSSIFFCKFIGILQINILITRNNICLFQTKSTLTVITAKWYKSTDTLMSQRTKKGGK